MSDLKELYQEMILDHQRKPHNYCKLAGANRHAEGYNPLCGDHLNVYLKLKEDRVEEVSFEGSGCAISKASASLMTMAIKGKSRQEIEKLFGSFHEMVTSKPDHEIEEKSLGKLLVFSGVREFPSRVKCAILAWHTLKAAMDGKDQPVSTEEEELRHGNH